MTDSMLSIFDSDPKLGEELMSLTPPHDMDSLFPELLDIPEASVPQQEVIPKQEIPKRSGNASLINVEVINQDLDLEQFLTNQNLNTWSRTKRSNSFEQQHSPVSVGSDDVDSTLGYGNSKCMSKSAIAARENRMKKKQHIDALERSVRNLTAENTELKGTVNSLNTSVKSLRTEVEYLKGIIANQSTLASLLQNIPGTPGVRLASSEFSDADNNNSTPTLENTTDNNTTHGRRAVKRKAQHDHGYATHRSFKQEKTDTKPAGVCLHVSGSSVSLEFCATCSNKAASCLDNV